MRIKIRKRSILPIVLVSMLCVISSHTFGSPEEELQKTTVTGTVTSLDSDETIVGVNIVEKGTTNGTVTDIDGNYSISVSEEATLVFSYVGYINEEVIVGGKSVINMSLSPDLQQLEELVVIGYGTVKKSDLTGAVSSLKEESLNKGVNVSVDQMLQARAAGVQVYQNSSEPGGGLSIQVRGVNSITAGNQPLYVIDGLPVDNGNVIAGTGEGFTGSRTPRNPLNALNPNDIESIEILKDASAAAIYGSRGANGVILITTKKGQEGKLRVTYDGYYGSQSITKKLDVLTPTEYQTVLNELIDDGAVYANVGEQVDEIQGDGTDWQDEVFRTAPVHSHNVSFTGGGNGNKYYASVGYFNQEGVVVSSGIERYSLRFNLENNVNDKFNFGMNLNSSYVYDDFIANGVVPNENAGVISTAIDFDPTLNIFDEDGNYQQSPFITKENPLAVAYGWDAIAKNFRTFGTVFGEYFFMPSLSLKVNLGGDIASSKRDVFIDSRSELGRDAGGIGTVISGIKYNYLTEAWLNYHKKIGSGHDLRLMAGATAQKFFTERLNSSTSGFVTEATGTNNLQSGTQANNLINTSKFTNTLQSFLGRAIYNYKDKYLLTASIRADGSSRFGINNRYSYFPSAAVGWRISNEDFIDDQGILSDLKLRVSYGQIGNQAIGNGNSQTTFNADNRPMIFGDQQVVGYSPSRFPNPDLKWETTTQTDVGVDFGFFGGRITGTLDYYYKKTTDLLLRVPVPSQTGFVDRLENVGSVENKGFEFSMNSRNIVGEFTWTTNLNGATISNKVLSLGENIDQIIQGSLQFTPDISIMLPGETMNSYYGYEVLGVWQTDDDLALSKQGAQPGDLKYNDINGDSLITADDRTIIGDPIPSFTWGMMNELTYKGLNLSFSIQGVHGVDLLNNQLRDTYYPINFRRNKLAEPYLNRWTPENPTNEYPSFINPGSQGSNVVNTLTVEDASYVRIQNVTLGYTFPAETFNVFKSLHVYLSVNNVATFTDYSGYDPGANINGTSNAALRIDYNAYPLARTFTGGVRVGF